MAQQHALGGRAASIQSALDAIMPAVRQHYDAAAATHGAQGLAKRVRPKTYTLSHAPCLITSLSPDLDLIVWKKSRAQSTRLNLQEMI